MQVIYLLSRSNFQSTPTISNLSGGTYYVIITDNHNCSKRDSIVIAEPAALVIVDTVTNIGCSGGNGSINIGVTGGTPGYIYNWTGSAPDQEHHRAGRNIHCNSNRQYTCTATISATIIQPSPLTIASDSITNVTCNGAANGSISVVITGGTTPYTYNWSNGNHSASNTGLSGNTYTLTVTDANSCSITGSYTVAEPALLASTVTGTNVSCHGAANGSATVTAGGGTSPYTYLWSNFQSTPTISNLSGGTYYVIITDSHNCSKRDSITIAEPAALVIVDTVTNIGCSGGNGSINIGVTGGTPGYTYNWTGGATTQNITGLAGTYTVTVTDSHTCTATASATIIQPAPLTIASDSITNVTCNGAANGSISVVITGGTTPYTYNWSPTGGNSANNTGLSGNTYTLTVTDANNCSSNAVATR